jgi:hypothetical protein
LYELQIAALFPGDTKYDKAFSSCNISRNEFWCGECPKCAFVYLVLNPFLTQDRMKSIFGDKDFFENSHIQKHIIDLVGLGDHKPFECVGTKDESRAAVALAIFKYRKYGLNPPSYLAAIDSQLGLTENSSESEYLEKIHSDWSNDHFLPQEYSDILQSSLKGIVA